MRVIVLLLVFEVLELSRIAAFDRGNDGVVLLGCKWRGSIPILDAGCRYTFKRILTDPLATSFAILEELIQPRNAFEVVRSFRGCLDCVSPSAAALQLARNLSTRTGVRSEM